MLTQEQKVTFLWRVWNTIKLPLLAIAGVVFGKVLADIAFSETVMVVASWHYWDGVLVEVAKYVSFTLGVGTLAGYEKITNRPE